MRSFGCCDAKSGRRGITSRVPNAPDNATRKGRAGYPPAPRFSPASPQFAPLNPPPPHPRAAHSPPPPPRPPPHAPPPPPPPRELPVRRRGEGRIPGAGPSSRDNQYESLSPPPLLSSQADRPRREPTTRGVNTTTALIPDHHGIRRRGPPTCAVRHSGHRGRAQPTAR